MTWGSARLAAVALAVLTAACGGTETGETGSSAAASTTPGVQLSAEVVQSRQDQVTQVVRVGLSNQGADDVAVRQVRLVAPPFSPGPVDRSDRPPLAAGRRVDVRVPYGVPDCAGDPTAVEDPHVALVLGDARTDVVVPVDGRVLDRLLQRLCGEQRVAELADIGFAEDWTRDGDGVIGTLEIRRNAGVAERPELVLVDTVPTVIFSLTPLGGSAPAVATLPADEDIVSVPVRVGSPRCDPHALLESKKTYTFAARVSVDGGEPLLLPVEAQGTSREVMGGLLAELCDLS